MPQKLKPRVFNFKHHLLARSIKFRIKAIWQEYQEREIFHAEQPYMKHKLVVDQVKKIKTIFD